MEVEKNPSYLKVLIPTSTTADPTIGVWRLNIDRSSFALAAAPKISIMNIEAWGSGFKLSVDTVDEQGNKLHLEAAYKLDGKDYPLTGCSIADTISARRINESKTESVWRKDGKTTMTVRTIVSLDRQTLRVIRTGLGSLGRLADEMLIYESQ